MDKSSLLSAFNIHLLELLEDLRNLYPNDINIKTAIHLVGSMKKVNPKILIKGWKNCVNDEYKKEAINIAYGKIFEAPVVKKFQSNPNAIIVERFVYRPDLYKPGEKIIEDRSMKYVEML